jgi:hypothetical protein
VLGPVGGPLVDPAAHAALQDNRLGAPGHRVIGRPPGADAGGPDGEGVAGGAGHVEGHAQRSGHPAFSGVFSAALCSQRALGCVLGHQPEALRGVAPDLLEVLLDRAQPLSAQVVDPAGTPGLLRDQAGLLQQPQVPGHRGTADRQRGGDLADRLVALAEQAQDVTPVRVAERLERIAGGIGNHRATVTRRLPMHQAAGGAGVRAETGIARVVTLFESGGSGG